MWRRVPGAYRISASGASSTTRTSKLMSLLRPCRDIAATDLCIGVSAVSIQSADTTAVLKTPAAIRPILRPLHVIAPGNHRGAVLFGEDDAPARFAKQIVEPKPKA